MDKTKKTRAIELGKDIVILVLLCTAACLAVRTFWPGALQSLQGSGGTEVSAADGREQLSVILPARVALTEWNGESVTRYGVQYDSESCTQLFQPVASLLREALSSPGAVRTATEREWREMLSGSTNLCFDLLGEVPLSVLSAWLSGEENEALEGSARRLALSVQGEEVFLYYQDGDGTYYVCQTDLVSADQVSAAAGSVTDNGASFAFELEQYDGLDGDTMILPQQPEPRVYTASNPLEGESQSGIETLLSALSFPENSYTYSGSGTEQVIRSGVDTLRVSADGVVTYKGAEGERSRYQVPAQGGKSTLYEMVEACRALAQDAVGELAGAARLYLRSCVQTQEGWQVDFDYSLDGAPVQLGESQCAASFLVSDGEIAQFTLYLRSYADTGSRSMVLPELQAMAAMEALGQRGRELTLAYTDRGGDTVSAGWAAR